MGTSAMIKSAKDQATKAKAALDDKEREIAHLHGVIRDREELLDARQQKVESLRDELDVERDNRKRMWHFLEPLLDAATDLLESKPHANEKQGRVYVDLALYQEFEMRMRALRASVEQGDTSALAQPAQEKSA